MARGLCYHATSHASTQGNGKTDGDVGSVSDAAPYTYFEEISHNNNGIA